jgi:hypothetical protein
MSVVGKDETAGVGIRLTEGDGPADQAGMGIRL